MELSSTNIAAAVQIQTASLLNSALSGLSVEFFPENSRDIDFQVKEALAKQGIACIVATPELEYQGHDNINATYDATVELQVAENPMMNRARMRKQDLKWGTCLDVAVAGCEALAGPSSKSFMKYVPTRITQENEGALVIARAQLETHAWPQHGWLVKAWPTQPHLVGKLLLKTSEDEFSPDIVTTWGEDGYTTVVERFTTGISVAKYFVEDTPAEEQWATREVQGKLNILDFSQNGGPTLARV